MLFLMSMMDISVVTTRLKSHSNPWDFEVSSTFLEHHIPKTESIPLNETCNFVSSVLCMELEDFSKQSITTWQELATEEFEARPRLSVSKSFKIQLKVKSIQTYIPRVSLD